MEQVTSLNGNEGVLLKSGWKSVSDSSSNNSSGGFECNICLDSVLDPVVTMCGHLYCWPCIYKWINYQSGSSEQAVCPVCKVQVSHKTLIPLYGPGCVSSDQKPDGKTIIPQRPPTPRCTVPPPITATPTVVPPPTAINLHNYQLLGGGHPVVGMFGEIFYTRMFGNSESSATLYTYPPSSYHLPGSASPRVRRHVMEVDKSLTRLCFFLFCCMVLCLLLF